MRAPARPGARTLLAALAAALPWIAPASAATFVDPLDSPARPSALATRSLLNAVTVAGTRLVAVGQRGHVVYSDDQGATWAQAAVPVSVDLNAVHFPTARRGWAVGHGGVVLATEDGGRTWAKQLDAAAIGRLLAASSSAAGLAPALRRQVEVLAPEQGQASLLDVWFDDERTGFAVGAFNLVLRTGDGGASWTPWLDRADNPDGLHLYAIRRAAGRLYAVGERGLVLALDGEGRRFVRLALPYAGTLFGLSDTPAGVVVFGLRGHALRSADGGARWQELPTGVDTAITGATTTPDGRLVLVTGAGEALVGAADGAFRPLPLRRRLPLSAVVAAGPGTLALAGAGGVRVEALP